MQLQLGREGRNHGHSKEVMTDTHFSRLTTSGSVALTTLRSPSSQHLSTQEGNITGMFRSLATCTTTQSLHHHYYITITTHYSGAYMYKWSDLPCTLCSQLGLQSNELPVDKIH